MNPIPLSTRPLTSGLIATAALALTLSGCGGSDSKDSASSYSQESKPAATAAPANEKPKGTIKVVEAEYSLKSTPAAGKATSGSGKVTFDVENAGALSHEFVVLRTDQKADALLKGEEADEKGNVGEIGNIDAGQSKTLSLKLKPGHYALICNLPGHYMPGGKPGMSADFTVQ